MENLNYHHLRYFWHVVREGGLVQAGKVLRLSHPTLSAQVHALEDQLGEALFVKSGRRLVLTEAGRVPLCRRDFLAWPRNGRHGAGASIRPSSATRCRRGGRSAQARGEALA